MWSGLRNGSQSYGGRGRLGGGCVRAGFLKKGFPSAQMDQSSGKAGEGGRVLKAEERIPSREETVGATKEDMVGGEGMLAGKLVGGNEEGTGPERG